MIELKISDQDIESTEQLLLPRGAHFADDAKTVIRCWQSTDVAACPGSGKTTVLLAKLKILADRMPLENGSGVCVLSHTNIAVNEIKNQLTEYADKIFGYPNYIGTIQSFVDRFVTLPYLRKTTGRNIQAVDDNTYAKHMLGRMQGTNYYKSLNYVINNRFRPGGKYNELIEYVQSLYIGEDGALHVGNQKRALAGAGRASTVQYNKLIEDLLKNDGLMRYRDAYRYAKNAIKSLPKAYTDLFALRFRYVFIDEYQDCDAIQRQAIDAIFDSSKCVVIKIGDSNQAIYNSPENQTLDWIPQDDYLSIQTSCRYSQEIADIICKLKADGGNITTSLGKTGFNPVLIIFHPENAEDVIDEFINQLEKHELYDKDGIYKAIGAVKKENTAGLKIGSYWPEFDGSSNKKNEYNYWLLVNEITANLLNGNIYKAEQNVRKLLCRIFSYANIVQIGSGREHSVTTIKKVIDEKYQDVYRQWILEMSQINRPEQAFVDGFLRKKINELLKIRNPQIDSIFESLPSHFFEKVDERCHAEATDKNVFLDPTRNRKIQFDTIHGVKGETHDATLYLETDRQGASDINRILPFLGKGKADISAMYDYSRKLAYVGMSRPRKLLCVAIQDKTYEKGKNVFSGGWEIVDLRKK